MKVQPRKILDDFMRKHADAKGPLESWYAEVSAAHWDTPSDIKLRYQSASFLPQNYVIFNIKGNRYRLVTKLAYNSSIVLVKWIGTHAEYDKKTFP